DGNTEDDDHCDSDCKLEENSKCTGTDPSVCSATVCGDGNWEGPEEGGTEQCDDGNRLPYDGCDDECRNEPDCGFHGDSTYECNARCGDGMKFPSEACDDGNTVDGDGCSSDCEVEEGYSCT